MKIYNAIITFVLTIFIAIVPEIASSSSADERRPNILFLFSDDQRPDTFGALGNDLIETPHLDRLIREGTTFTQATAAHPLCVPVRAELLTGVTGFTNGIHPPRNEPNLELPTIAEVLQEEGYHTWMVGKWMVAGRPSTRGFTESLGLFGGGGTSKEPQYDDRGRIVTGYSSWQFQTDDRQILAEEGVGLTPDISEKFADAAIEFIHRQPQEPFFLHVNFTAPHDPLLMPAGYENMYKPGQMPLPPNFMSEHPFDHGNLDGRDEQLNPWPRTPGDIRADLATYYAVISHMDEQIGRILHALEETGQADETLIVFASDHGLALGSHGLMGKHNMYEHSINTPVVFVGPGIPQGEQRTAQCYLRDLYPTFLDFAGVPILDHLESKSLVPVIQGETDKIYPFIVGYFNDYQRMIRQDNLKYVWYPEVSQKQLFDLKDDPHELHNLIDDPRYNISVKLLQEQLFEWLSEHNDPLLKGVKVQ
ncbi:MAG: sulfatase-like hydrolase/transferase [Balneolales bacterium]